MHCPYCRNTDTRVLDSRVADDGGSIRRRRTCSACERRFTTVELMQLTVLKRSGASRAVHPRQGDLRRPEGLQGPPGHRGPARLPRPGRRGRAPARGRRGDPGPRGRPGDPGPAARARRGRLPALRQRLPRLRVGRRLRGRDRASCARSARSPPQPLRADPDRPAWISGEAVRAGRTKRRHRLSVPAAMIEIATSKDGTQRDDRDGERGSRRPGAGRDWRWAEDRAGLQHRGGAPVRRAHLGAPRRRADQLEDR